MRSKLLLLLICCLCYLAPASAQRQNVYFLKNSGKFVDQRDSADYMRIVKEPDSGSVLYNVTEYYLNSGIKMVGKTSVAEELRLEGQCIRFYPSGKKQELATYKSGILYGDAAYYYPNGKLYAIVEYLSSQQDPDYDLLIKTCNDSTGRSLVADSSGHFVLFNSRFSKILMEGDVKHGLKNGHWQMFLGPDSNTVTFEQTYKIGKLVAGQSEAKIEVSSNDYSNEIPAVAGLSSIGNNRFQPNFYRFYIAPQFNGGDIAFQNFLKANIQYPLAAALHRIKGTVSICLVVERDGTLTNMIILRDPGRGLGEEAVRVLKLSPRWIPAIKNGLPIRSLYTVPINFSLDGK